MKQFSAGVDGRVELECFSTARSENECQYRVAPSNAAHCATLEGGFSSVIPRALCG